MKYAIVEDSTVVNVAESYVALGDNWFQIPINCPVAIGDSYDGTTFTSTEGEIRLTPEQYMANERIAQLEDEKKLLTAQIQALSDRNDFVEDCMAEMAAIVYA